MREERELSEQLESGHGSNEKQIRDKTLVFPPFHKGCFKGTNFLDDSKNKEYRQLITYLYSLWGGDETVGPRYVTSYNLLKGFNK